MGKNEHKITKTQQKQKQKRKKRKTHNERLEFV